jgi:spore germination protein YaaH
VALGSVPLNTFLTGSAEAGNWVPAARAAIPPNLALQSNVYTVETTGTPPSALTLTVDLPTGAENTDIVDVYAWDATTGMWSFVPAQPNTAGGMTANMEAVPGFVALFQAGPPSPIVVSTVDVTQVLNDNVAKIATIISPAGMQPTLQGTLAGNPAPGFMLNAGYRVMPVIRNFADPRALDPDTVSAMLSNQTVRQEHVNQLTSFTASGGYDGVFIDYRELPAEQRENFTAFIQELGTSLSATGRLLGVVVPAADNSTGVWDTGAYDWRAIGASATYMQIDFGLNPADFAPGESRLVESMLRFAIGEVSRYKILLGLSAHSVREAAGDFTTIGYDEALSSLGNVALLVEASDSGTIAPGSEIQARMDGLKGVSGLDTLVQSPFIDFQAEDGTNLARIWLTTGDALRFRMDRGMAFGLAGAAFDDLLADDLASDIPTSILNYKLQMPSAQVMTPGLALRWRIESADTLLDEVITDLNEDLVVTIAAPDGNYAINVAVVGDQTESDRSGASVAVFAATETPTPLPTSTPTPEPTATPTPAPVIPTQPAATAAAPVIDSGANPAPVAPPSGSIGNFEYGGHVTSAGTTAGGTMKGAGMSWMKVQLRYNLGASPDIAAAAINDAHGQGFKILLGIVGHSNELAAGGAAYVNDFANFLGGVAALGPDAIEVWNEPNIDREWPRGQISGEAYADMLRQAYQKIKSVNGSVRVISAAPAPTGAEAAYPGQVVNDNNWLQQMVNAGGLQYADCVGAHYNEGIVPPGQTGGDPRDNYYTRYFWGMVNTYWGIIGGQRPICFTELGYLTPEGFSALPAYFAWAQNVTLAQHTAWLAEAASLSAQSGKVQMMIIWNVDFTAYGADPMAGYAIIRPGGSCPACNALAAAR